MRITYVDVGPTTVDEHALGETFEINVSKQSAGLLDQLAEHGIYGRSRAEVAARFVDKALQSFFNEHRLTMQIGRLR